MAILNLMVILLQLFARYLLLLFFLKALKAFEGEPFKKLMRFHLLAEGVS